MIPRAFITEWSSKVPWQTNEQVEQDLIICRSLVEIYNDPFLSTRLAFRGGTALHKIFLSPQPRYSEDIDLVQIVSEPIKETIVHLRERLAFLGKASVAQKQFNNTLVYRFESEFPPVQKLKLKIETNCREHFSVLGHIESPFSVASEYFSGDTKIITFTINELLGTKLRALYQRSKGRDLFDLHKALISASVSPDAIVHCYKEYMKFSVGHTPTKKEYQENLALKIKDPEFLGDTTGLLRPDGKYDPTAAYDLVAKVLIERM
jgi:predicted nucleotidyltransferase component of viral defense system